MDNWKNKNVLITGASAGIGECFARQLAAKNANLILVARRKDKLQNLAKELMDKYKISVEVIASDLAQIDSAQKLFEETENKKLQVDVLINNAGFGIGGTFVESSLERNLEMIQLNITTLVALTHLYLQPMIKRKDGAVINVASVAAFQAVPYLGTYAATKAFVLSFSEALWYECRDSNVTVMALCPGATTTEFFEVAGIKERAGAQTSEEVVQVALQGLKEKRSHIVSGWMNFLMRQSSRFIPREFVTCFAGSLFKTKSASN